LPWYKPISRILSCRNRQLTIIHLGRTLPSDSSDLPENTDDVSIVHRAGSPLAFSYLVLHHEEFTWPRMFPCTPVSSYLTVSPLTFEKAGLFSVALVVIAIFWRFPGVTRLVALWCSDFPLSYDSDRPVRPTAKLEDYSKNCSVLKRCKQGFSSLWPSNCERRSKSVPDQEIVWEQMCPF